MEQAGTRNAEAERTWEKEVEGTGRRRRRGSEEAAERISEAVEARTWEEEAARTWVEEVVGIREEAAGPARPRLERTWEKEVMQGSRAASCSRNKWTQEEAVRWWGRGQLWL